MAGGATFDEAGVTAVAARHRDGSDMVDKYMNQLLQDAQTVQGSSGSNMTTAAVSVVEQVREECKKIVVQPLNELADMMTQVVRDQVGQDEANAVQVNSVAEAGQAGYAGDSQSFLAG